MPTHPIGDQPMNSGQRSARSNMMQRQELADTRSIMKEAADMLMKHGHYLSANGQRVEAHESFRMVELIFLQIHIMNKRLAPHEDKLETMKLPPRKGFTMPKARESLILTKDLV